MDSNLSLEETTKLGEKYYLEVLRSELEKTHFGQYVVIDVEKKDYVVGFERLATLDEAREKFGPKIFYVAQIGLLKEPTINYQLAKRHAWNF